MVDACHETLGYNTVLTVGIVVVMVCQVLVVRRGLKVSYFLRKANALKFNASGQTLFGAIVAPFFGFFVSLSYFLVLIDVDDSEYSIFDNMRPICFALMAFFVIWETATLSFMWLDILAKSKMDATAKKVSLCYELIKRSSPQTLLICGSNQLSSISSTSHRRVAVDPVHQKIS